MRLIDADLLIKLLNEQKEKETGAYTKGRNTGLNVAKSIINDVTQTPTTYDIGKVVEELEATKETACELLKIPKFLKKDLQELVNMCFDEAIEIVKQGGVSDDVCVWHKVKNGNAYKCNTHAEIHDTRVLDWCRCPYCGKKIKVVE